MINFEYVISGMTMGTSNLYYDQSVLEPYVEVLNNKITFMDNKYPQQNISMLFNSHTEPSHGEAMHDLLNHWHNLYADSGGLQLSRTKKGLTPEIKDKIYKHQAKYSDIAMIFDDIPVEFDGSNSGWSMKTSTFGRRFARDLIGNTARSTLANVKRQIEVFNALESDTKITLIVQGQDIESYREYIETIVEGLTEEELQRCCGISLSSACSGASLDNRMEMIYAVKDLEIPMSLKENIHLLGVGSHKMMMPFFISPDYFNFVKNVSYDSSTHANSWFFSRYRDENWINIDIESPATTKKDHDWIYRNQLVPVFSDLYQKNQEAFEAFDIPNYDFLIDECTKWSLRNKEKKIKWHSDQGYHGSHLLAFFNVMQTVEHYMGFVDKYTNNPKLLNDRGLSKITDYGQFVNEWLPLQGSQDKLPEQWGGSLNEFFT